MRFAIFLAALLIAISCTETVGKAKDSAELTESQKRKIFSDSFAFTDRNFPDRRDSFTSFEAFMNKYYKNLKAANKYNDFFYSMEEEYIDTTKIDSTKHFFRILVNPSFGRPYCLRLNKIGNKSELILKATNGYGGYYPGILELQLRFQYADTLYENTIRKLKSIDFPSFSFYEPKCSTGFDGEEWMFELIEGGKYHIIYRRSPEYCGDSLTKELGKLGLKIKELGKLEKVLAALKN